MLLKGEVRTYCKYYTAQPASPMPPRDGTGWLSSPTIERTQRPSQQLTNPSSPAFRVYRESWDFPRKRISRATLHNKSRSNRAGASNKVLGFYNFEILRCNVDDDEVRTHCKYYTAQPASPTPPGDGTVGHSSPTIERTQLPTQQLTNRSSRGTGLLS